MSWKIVLENHQCVFHQRSHPHCWAHCHNNDNPRRGDCTEKDCPISLNAVLISNTADKEGRDPSCP